MSKSDETTNLVAPPAYPGGYQPPPPPGGYPQAPPPDGYPQAPPPDGYPQAPPPDGYPKVPPAGSAYPQPPPPGYGAAVVVTQPTVVQTVVFRETPVLLVCPHCQAHVTTLARPETGTFTWLIAGILCLFGCWLGCCLIPFCVDSLQDAVHSCPNCSREVGRYNRM